MEKLPSACRSMLEVCAPNSLGMAKDERVACQTRVVQMIGDAFAEVRTEKEQYFASVDENVTKSEAEKTKLEDAQDAAATAGLASIEEVAAHMEEATRTHAEVVKARAALAAATEECTAMEPMQNSFGLLKDGQCEEPDEIKNHLDVVRATAIKFNIPDAITCSLPAILAKKNDQRSSFEQEVVQEAERIIREDIARIQGAVRDGPATIQEAENTAQERAKALEVAQTLQTERKAAQKEAAQALREFMPTFKEAVKSRDSLKCKLEAFVVGPLAAFEILRDRVSTPPELESTMAEVDNSQTNN